MGDYKRLDVWRKAHQIACTLYGITGAFDRADWYLRDQIRRAAISIGANIAEGCGRNGDGELRRFVSIALGSANELRYLLELAIDLGVLPGVMAQPLIGAVDEVRRMLAGLSARARQAHPRRPEKGRPPSAPSESLTADSR